MLKLRYVLLCFFGILDDFVINIICPLQVMGLVMGVQY